jgi:hypothetical protein
MRLQLAELEFPRHPRLALLVLLWAVFGVGQALAAVLPDDRVDVLYHGYDGGGVEVDGPSVLVLKQIGQNGTITGNYYLDSVSSASVDVVTQGSPYTEERREYSLGGQYMHGESIMSLAYTNSAESDYNAETFNFGISIDTFGDLTTVSLGYGLGDDEVRRNGDPNFKESAKRQNYRVSVSQVLTKNLLMSFNWETITDEGYLNNPYRSVRYLIDPNDPNQGYAFQPEVYPQTRTSNALAIRGRYYLPYRAALRGEYRAFKDTWDIDASTLEVGYTQPVKGRWILDFKYRYYTQDGADFYSDLFPRFDAQNFLSRDKELSTFTSQVFGFGVSYEFGRGSGPFFNRGTANLKYDYMLFDYDDYRDLRVQCSPPEAAGCEPLYSFSANVLQLFVSIFF